MVLPLRFQQQIEQLETKLWKCKFLQLFKQNINEHKTEP